MADENDDLMGFFSEINKIEDSVVSSISDVVADVNPNVTVFSKPKVISKKPEMTVTKAIESSSSSCPVYTYDFGPSENNLGTQSAVEINQLPSQYTKLLNTFESTASSSSSSSSSSLSIQPSLSYVPLPSIPRQNKKFVRTGAGEIWVDDSLNEWPENDYRIFVGDLAKEVTTDTLAKHFQSYKSFAKAKVIRTKFESKARGFGFVSFMDPMDCAKAIREQNGKVNSESIFMTHFHL
jgi:RNA recognition motif-containing protein